jgi:flagellar basal body-associated protein FliL
MKQEKVILSFIMVLIGLLVAGIVFYFYQSGNKPQKQISIFASPTPLSRNQKSLDLSVSIPEDETIVTDKELMISGQTDPNATIFIITKSDQEAVTPDKNGKFNAKLTLDKDQNIITVISILPNGESVEVQKTYTYSTTSF